MEYNIRSNFLDCTLRDGGYYNNWDFDKNHAFKLVENLSKAGVSIIELGYKSNSNNKFQGIFKYCSENILASLRKFKVGFAFMVDAKEFIVNDQIDNKSLDNIIVSEEDSLFTWVRIATHLRTVNACGELIQYFKNKGYKVCLNLMGGSLISDENLSIVSQKVQTLNPDVFYIADSFGSFYPTDIEEKIEIVRTFWTGEIGIHLHDNQGMAFANAQKAISLGVNYIDGTVQGMGRGAGNLLLEQVLLYCKQRLGYSELDPDRLLDSIHSFINPLKNKYKWGFSYNYMLSGLHNIHPSYCQNLYGSERYTSKQISSILASIPKDSKIAFREETMKHTASRVIDRTESDTLTIPNRSVNFTDNILILANGPSLYKYLEFIELFAMQESLMIVECNDILNENPIKRTTVILNKIKLEKSIFQNKKNKLNYITGVKYIKKQYHNLEIQHQDFRIGNELSIPDSNTKEIVLTDYDVGMFTLSMAIMDNPKSIFLAGFDGFEEENKNDRFDLFLENINEICKERKINLLSLTPTRYTNIQIKSLFSLI